MLVAMADWTNMHDRNVPQVALKAVWNAVMNHSILVAMLMENEEGAIRFFAQKTGDGLIATQRNIMDLIANGQHPGGRNFPGYSAFEPDVACPYNHKDLAPFSVNAASREQAATVNLTKHKRD